MGVFLCCVVGLAFIFQSHSLDIDNPLYRFKRYQASDWSDPSDCAARTKQPVVVTNTHNITLDIRMPGVIPAGSDNYLCMAVPVPLNRDSYIVDFVPHASMDTAHHMLLYGCQTPVSTSDYWDCGSVQGTCEDEASIMYAWARNAPPTKLPKDVGFRVGGTSGISYFVLQIHYGDISAFRDHHRDCSGLTLRMTSKPQPFVAGMYLLMSVDTIIPPGKRVTNADIACEYESFPIYPFAFRTHTHHLGKVVSGYRIRDGRWTLIGRQSPQLPQAFYPANKEADVKDGDTIAARCVFTGEGRTSKTYIGGTSGDEMCNFYIMYYMDSRNAIPFMNCMQTGSNELFRHIPLEANVPIAVSPDHMMSMMHSGHTRDHQDDRLPLEPKEEVWDQDYHLEEVITWPESQLQLGQVSGVALDSDANLVIFHRGDHRWGVNSFDGQDRYQQRSLGPIQQSTILVVDQVKGQVLKASGRNMFYLPHGITTDTENNYWVTDVALHQVMKISSRDTDKPLVVLGEAFIPGSDKNHFCQPTDVAVDTMTGNIYVSDGYCNARIIKLSPDGRYLSEWGAGSSDRRRRLPFRIPHSLAYLPDRQELCVADRENGRIQCFVAKTGEFIKEIKRDEFRGAVYAIAYSPAGGGLIYAVNGESPYSHSAPLRGFVINYSTKEIVDAFSPDKQAFKMPHDIVVNKDGVVFVGDAGSDTVFKFTSEKAHRSVKKGGIEVQELQEIETLVQTNLKPVHKVSVSMALATQQKTAAVPDKQTQPPQAQQKQSEGDRRKLETAAEQSSRQGVSPAVITTLLLIPLVLVISIGIFIRWRKSRMYGDGFEVKLEPNSGGGILGKLRGKAAGGLNLGNFFATHKGYTRQGFDRLSTEGSDQEKDDEDTTDSENEEYSAPPPPPVPSS
ncbi:peptidyl-glycine alpha-amidating monooxygenase B isoform 1-T3 [Polymixia lowei]